MENRVAIGSVPILTQQVVPLCIDAASDSHSAFCRLGLLEIHVTRLANCVWTSVCGGGGNAVERGGGGGRDRDGEL